MLRVLKKQTQIQSILEDKRLLIFTNPKTDRVCLAYFKRNLETSVVAMVTVILDYAHFRCP